MFSHGKLVTVLQYFTDKIDDYWHILYPITPSEKRKEDKYLYFYDISRKALDYKGKFSEDGIYMFYGYDGKYHIHPLEISQYSLACWLAWRKTSNKRWIEKAILHCDWLIENQYDDGGWRIEHKNPRYKDLPEPWPSALAQGLAISSLIRAFYFTENKKYLNSARKACDFLEKDISNGGVKRSFKKEKVEGFIYEEYPRKNLSGVLNGYISAILGIYELSQIEEDYKKLFDRNIKNLKKILPLYDTGFWSYYSLDGNIASGFYHRYVIIQLKALCEFDSEFFRWYKRFNEYLNCKTCKIKAFINKLTGKK